MRSTRQKNRICVCIAAVLVSALVLVAGDAHAQNYLLDDNVKIQRHDKRTSPYVFDRNAEGLESWGMQFEQSVWNPDSPEEARLIQYEKLPRCDENKVKLHEVIHHTPGTDKTDVLFYSESDPAQKQRAAKYDNFKVPYQAALMRDRKTNQAEYWQMFARFIQIDCLPTRFRFTYIGSERYMEYRLGDTAWQSK